MPATTLSAMGKPGWRRAGLVLAQLCLVAALLALWQFGVSDRNVAFFSRPSIVGAKLVELALDPDFHRDIIVTLTEIAIGYAIGAGVGLVLGFVLGRSKFLSNLLEPFIIGLTAFPKLRWRRCSLSGWGLGFPSKVAVVVLASFFLCSSTLTPASSISMRNWCGWPASWARRGASASAEVILPSAAHQIFIGLKTAVPYAVIGAVIGEYIGSNEGLGHFILYASQTYDAPALFSGIVALILIVFLCNYALNRLERRLVRWRHIEGAAVQL